MLKLINRNTGEVIERHDYSFEEFITNRYSRFCSLKTEKGIIIGDVHPELMWIEEKETK